MFYRSMIEVLAEQWLDGDISDEKLNGMYTSNTITYTKLDEEIFFLKDSVSNEFISEILFTRGVSESETQDFLKIIGRIE